MSLFLKFEWNVVALRVTRSLSTIDTIDTSPASAKIGPAASDVVEKVGPTTASASLATTCDAALRTPSSEP